MSLFFCISEYVSIFFSVTLIMFLWYSEWWPVFLWMKLYLFLIVFILRIDNSQVVIWTYTWLVPKSDTKIQGPLTPLFNVYQQDIPIGYGSAEVRNKWIYIFARTQYLLHTISENICRNGVLLLVFHLCFSGNWFFPIGIIEFWYICTNYYLYH